MEAGAQSASHGAQEGLHDTPVARLPAENEKDAQALAWTSFVI
jgi:hypothetical protein